jgi:hypothetical protein
MALDANELLDQIDGRLAELEAILWSSSGPSAGNGIGNFTQVTITDPSSGTPYIESTTSSPPTLLTLTPGTFFNNSFIDVGWTAPVDGSASVYEVQWAKKTGASYETPNAFRVGGNSYRIPNVIPGQTYGVKVFGVNRIGIPSTTLPSSGYQDVVAATDATAPVAPTGVVATAAIRSIIVRWNDNAEADMKLGAGIYQVDVASDVGFVTIVKTTRIAGTVATFADLASGTQYWVRVYAIDSSGNQSGASATATATTALAIITDVDQASLRDTQTSYLVSAGQNNPSLPASYYSAGGANIGQLQITLSGATAGDMFKYAQPLGFDGNVIAYGGQNRGAPFTFGTYYKGLQPGRYRVVFYVRSGDAGVYPGQAMLEVCHHANPGVGLDLESDQFTIITAADLGCPVVQNPDGSYQTGNCDGRWHAFAIPMTILRPWAAGEDGIEFYVKTVAGFRPSGSTVDMGTRTWELSHIIVVPKDALIQNEVTASYIAAGAIVAGKAAIGSIQADNLTVGANKSPGNAIANPGFEDNARDSSGNVVLSRAAAWTYDYETTGPGVTSWNLSGTSGGLANGFSGSQVLSAVVNTGGSSVASKGIPVIAGETWYISALAADDQFGGNIGRFYLRVLFGTTASGGPDFIRTAAGVTLTDIYGNIVIGDVAKYEGQVTVPANAIWMRVALYAWPGAGTGAHSMYFDDVVARKVVSTVQIADGAIVAVKIAANTITATQIAANTITGGNIAGATITGTNIAANTIDAGSIKTSTLTAATITLNGGALQAGSPPTSGLLINSQGLRLYSGSVAVITLDVSGSATFAGNITSTATISGGTLTGATIIGGVIETASSGRRIVINSIDTIQMISGAGYYSEANINFDGFGDMYINGSRATSSTAGAPQIWFTGASGAGNGGALNLTVPVGDPNGKIWLNSAVLQLGNSTGTPATITNYGTTSGYAAAQGSWNVMSYVAYNSNNTTIAGYGIWANNQAVKLDMDTNDIIGVMSVNSNNTAYGPFKGSAFVVGSSEKTKTNIRTIKDSHREKIAKLRPVRFKRPAISHEVREDGTRSKTKLHPLAPYNEQSDFLGFIAEEMVDHYPESVFWSLVGDKPAPTGIDYGSLVVPTIKVVQEHEAEIVALRKRVDQLEAKLAA